MDCRKLNKWVRGEDEEPDMTSPSDDAKLVERLRKEAVEWQKAWEGNDLTSPGNVAEEIAQTYREAAGRLSSLIEEREKVKTFLARFTKYDVHEHDLSHVQKQAAILLEKMKAAEKGY